MTMQENPKRTFKNLRGNRMLFKKNIFLSISIALIMIFQIMFTGCDLTVDNPGPTGDVALDDPGAHEAVWNGSRFSLAQSLARLAFMGSEPALEAQAGERVHPIKLPLVSGQLQDDEINGEWNIAHEARYTAEEGVRRFERVMDESDFNSNPLVAKTLMNAGYANRLLGENMCAAVIDGGSEEPHTVHLERAEDYFTRALNVAQQANEIGVVEASYAGRAQVRLLLEDFDGAVSDASMVGDDFIHQMEYTITTDDHYNFIFWLNDNNPYRSNTVHQVYYEDYYENTGDPRVRWEDTEDRTAFDLPWNRQLKYTSRSSPMELAKAAEMKLIEAENELNNGNWESAMEIINDDIRSNVISDNTGAPLDVWDADNEEEAWTALKRERGIVLWLEGRRLGDLRRWTENNTPGEMEDMSSRSLCFPISEGERQANENIPLN